MCQVVFKKNMCLGTNKLTHIQFFLQKLCKKPGMLLLQPAVYVYSGIEIYTQPVNQFKESK